MGEELIDQTSPVAGWPADVSIVTRLMFFLLSRGSPAGWERRAFFFLIAPEIEINCHFFVRGRRAAAASSRGRAPFPLLTIVKKKKKTECLHNEKNIYLTIGALRYGAGRVISRLLCRLPFLSFFYVINGLTANVIV